MGLLPREFLRRIDTGPVNVMLCGKPEAYDVGGDPS